MAAMVTGVILVTVCVAIAGLAGYLALAAFRRAAARDPAAGGHGAGGGARKVPAGGGRPASAGE